MTLSHLHAFITCEIGRKKTCLNVVIDAAYGRTVLCVWALHTFILCFLFIDNSPFRCIFICFGKSVLLPDVLLNRRRWER